MMRLPSPRPPLKAFLLSAMLLVSLGFMSGCGNTGNLAKDIVQDVAGERFDQVAQPYLDQYNRAKEAVLDPQQTLGREKDKQIRNRLGPNIQALSTDTLKARSMLQVLETRQVYDANVALGETVAGIQDPVLKKELENLLNLYPKQGNFKGDTAAYNAAFNALKQKVSG